MCDSWGAVARGRADYPVWTHVREAGDRADRGQLATGQRTSGARARDASGSAGEEAATEADRDAQPSQCVFGEGISAGTQPAVCAEGGEARGLSSPGAACGRARQDLPAGERADDQRGLGGAVREPLLSAGAPESALCPRKGSGEGMRRAGGEADDRISGPRAALAGNPTTSQAEKRGDHTLPAAESGSGAEGEETEVGATG